MSKPAETAAAAAGAGTTPPTPLSLRQRSVSDGSGGGGASLTSGSPTLFSATPLHEEFGITPHTPVMFNNNLFAGHRILVVSRIIPPEKLKARPALCINLIQSDCITKKDGTEIMQVADIVCRQHAMAISINVILSKASGADGKTIRFVSDEQLEGLRKGIAETPLLPGFDKLDIFLIGHYYDSHSCAERILTTAFDALAAIKAFDITKIHVLSCNSAKPIKNADGATATAADAAPATGGAAAAATGGGVAGDEDAATSAKHKVVVINPSLAEDSLQNKVAATCIARGIKTKVIGTNSLVFPHYVKAGEVHTHLLEADDLNDKIVKISELLERFPAASKKHTSLFLNYCELIRSNEYDGRSSGSKISITPEGVITATGVTKVIYDLTKEK